MSKLAEDKTTMLRPTRHPANLDRGEQAKALMRLRATLGLRHGQLMVVANSMDMLGRALRATSSVPS